MQKYWALEPRFIGAAAKTSTAFSTWIAVFFASTLWQRLSRFADGMGQSYASKNPKGSAFAHSCLERRYRRSSWTSHKHYPQAIAILRTAQFLQSPFLARRSELKRSLFRQSLGYKQCLRKPTTEPLYGLQPQCLLQAVPLCKLW